jgi:hypothetical protein
LHGRVPRSTFQSSALSEAVTAGQSRSLDWVWALAAVAFATDCGETVYTPLPEYEVRVPSPDAWSGTEALLVSDLFPVLQYLPTVTLDSDTLPVRRVDDTTLAARLPHLVGEHRLAVTFPGAVLTTTPDRVRLYGYRERFLAPPLKGNLFAWPEGSGRPMVLGAGPNGLIHYDLVHRVVARSWPDSVYAPWCGLSGAGTTWRVNTFLVQGRSASGGCTTYHLWQLLPTAALLSDSAPGWYNYESYWVTAEIAPHRWMWGDDHELEISDCRSIPCIFWVGRAFGAVKAVISPRGDRVIPVGSSRAWVIDPDRLDYAWQYQGLDGVWDAVFTPEGDTLFMVGPDTAGQEVLVAARADDGETLAVSVLSGPEGTAFSSTAVALDPAAPWIYVAGEVKADTMRTAALIVVDHRRLAQVAVLLSDDWVSVRAYGYPYDGLIIVPAPLADAVFVVGSYYDYDPPVRRAPVYRYDRMP